MDTLVRNQIKSSNSESLSGSEKNSDLFQKPNSKALLKELLKAKTFVPNSQAVMSPSLKAIDSPNSLPVISSATQPAIVRPETRHHLIDVHGLALFLRKATRCIQCFKTGCLSMMGNISRQQPPCVTKITIKCQICSFILQEDLKKPKTTIMNNSTSENVLSRKYQNSSSQNKEYQNSPPQDNKENPSSPPQDETWLEETQEGDMLPRKKKLKLSQSPPSAATNTQDSEYVSPLYNYFQSTTSSVSPKAKINIKWLPKEDLCNNIHCTKNGDISGKPSVLGLDSTQLKISSTIHTDYNSKAVPNKKMSKNFSADYSDAAKSSCISGDTGSNKKILVGTHENVKNNLSRSNNSTKSSNFNDFRSKIDGTESGQSVFVSKILDEFEEIQSRVSNPNANPYENDELDSKFSERKYKTEFMSKDYKYLDSITIENLNVSNINFQNNTSSLNQNRTSAKSPELRDVRIIRKLLNLTETLKEELIERKKELETGAFEETTSATFKIKKEPDDIASKLLNFPDLDNQNLFRFEKQPELIIPDFYVKGESDFVEEPTAENEENDIRDNSQPVHTSVSYDASNIATNARSVCFESDESEID